MTGITPKLVIVGGGKMGEALLAGLLRAEKYKPEEVLVVEPVEQRRTELAERYQVKVVSDTDDILAEVLGGKPSGGAGQLPNTILATKPDVIPTAAAAAAKYSNCILSIAAGVTIATLEQATTESTSDGQATDDQDASASATSASAPPIIRAMPNTPALVGQGATAISANDAGAPYLDWAEDVLSAVGVVVRTSETALDAVTGLSGSGPAYVFLVAEALIDAGVTAGLARPIATELTSQTLLGAATLLREGISEGTSAAELRANVTSPGGTTAAGLQVLEQERVRAAFISAVEAATKRSVQLGQAAANPPK